MDNYKIIRSEGDLEMRQYPTGEKRVVDAKARTASTWLHHSDLDADLCYYDLCNSLGENEE